MKHRFTLRPDPHARAIMANAWGMVQTIHAMGKDATVTVSEETRTLAQNRLMWDMLGDVSKQVVWHGVKMKDSEWKDFFSAILKGQKSVPNLEGTGFVILGQSTSNMPISEMSDMIELMSAFGAERDVRFKAHRQTEAA